VSHGCHAKNLATTGKLKKGEFQLLTSDLDIYQKVFYFVVVLQKLDRRDFAIDVIQM
jgi:hypothetical protein